MKKLTLSVLLLASLSACTNKSSHPDYFGTIKPTHPANELWIDCSGEPQYMDPAKISDNVSSGIANNMFLRLTQTDAKTGSPVPDLAKSWDISKSGLEYTFHLREEAKWSDDKPITADDVVWSWKRMIDPATIANYAQLADVIENARPFREQAIQISGVKMSDKQLLDKLKAIVPIKDIESDAKLGVSFAFIDSDDGDKKKEFREKLIAAIEKGALGASAKAAITTSDVIQIKALNEHDVWVKLNKPVPYFLGLVEYAMFSPVPQHVIEKFKKEGKEDQWTKPENIVVSGPFILIEEEFKQYKVFKKNPKYFNASKVRLDKVKTIMVEDYNANLNAYRTGQHDWSWAASLPTDMLETVRKYKDYHFDPQLGVYYYQINVTKKPLDNVDVRKALSLAIDRKSIVENITRQGQVPTRSLVPPGIPDYNSPKVSVFDSAEAKKLLAKAGYPDGKGFPKFTLKFNTSEGHRKIAEAIQQMWKSNLGIQIDIANMEWKSMLEDQKRKNFDLMRMAWIGDYLDPHTFLSIFLSESANNHTHWKNAKYDQLINASDRTLNQKERFKDFYEAEQILADEVPMIPIYGYTRSYMKKPFLRGFWPHYQDRHQWKYMWIDERWYKEVPNTDVPDEPWTE